MTFLWPCGARNMSDLNGLEEGISLLLLALLRACLTGSGELSANCWGHECQRL